MPLATSLAACTKCFLATGLLVLLLATLQALQRRLVCLAITVAAANTCVRVVCVRMCARESQVYTFSGPTPVKVVCS